MVQNSSVHIPVYCVYSEPVNDNKIKEIGLLDDCIVEVRIHEISCCLALLRREPDYTLSLT